MSWYDEMQRSNDAFLTLVWPKISYYCGNGKIATVKITDEDDVSTNLDVVSGIDFLVTIEDKGCIGIATRVQRGTKNWGSFTVRKSKISGFKTEYQKRKESIDSDGQFLYPFFTCQAYVNDGVLLGCGLAKTKDIILAINDESRTNKNPQDGTVFYTVYYHELTLVYEYDPEQAIAGNQEN